jgi:hypothetical protein
MKRLKVFVIATTVVITAAAFTLPASAQDNDSDSDGVPDYQDLCSNIDTQQDEPTPHGTNRWKFNLSETLWVQENPKGKGKGPQIVFTIQQTRGCNCNQILTWLQENHPEEFGQMQGHRKFGCSTSIMQDFASLSVKDWNLPDSPIGLRLEESSPGIINDTYFDLKIWDVGEGYDIYDGIWPAWCADSDVFIYQRTDYTPYVRSSLDPDLGYKCEHCTDDEKWNYVNYILNHKHPEADWMDIQTAIWYFTDKDPFYQYGYSEKAEAMVKDAVDNGAGFYPQKGQLGAVILDNGPDIQLVFLEVDP